MPKFHTVAEMIDFLQKSENRFIPNVEFEMPDETKNDPQRNLEEIGKFAKFLNSNLGKKCDKLTIQGQQISDQGIRIIADIIRNNSLSSLNLANTGMSDETYRIIGEAAAHSTALTFLDVSGNNIKDEGEKILDEIITPRIFSGKKIEIKYSGTGINAENYSEVMSEYEVVHEACKDLFVKFGLLISARFLKTIIETKNAAHLDLALHGFNYGMFESWIVNYTYNFGDIARKHLCESLTTVDHLKALLEHFHQPIPQRKLNSLMDYGNISWPSIFGRDRAGNIIKEIDIPDEISGSPGYKLVERVSHEELMKEGEDLEHCVGGYTSQCIIHDRHIFSIIDENGNSVSTMEVLLKQDDQKGFYITQHRGKKNAEVSAREKAIEAWLQRQVENGSITIDYEGLKQAKLERLKQARTLEEKAKFLLGFDVFDESKCRKIIKVFKEDIISRGAKSIPGLLENLQKLLELKEVEIRDEYMKLDCVQLLPLIEEKEKAPVVLAETSQQKKNREKNQQQEQELLTDIQKNIDRIFGEGLVKVIINSDVMELSSQHHKSSELIKIMKEIFPKFSYIVDIDEDQKIVIEGFKPKPFNQILIGAIKKGITPAPVAQTAGVKKVQGGNNPDLPG